MYWLLELQETFSGNGTFIYSGQSFDEFHHQWQFISLKTSPFLIQKNWYFLNFHHYLKPVFGEHICLFLDFSLLSSAGSSLSKSVKQKAFANE
jgi:hypothetical protein